MQTLSQILDAPSQTFGLPIMFVRGGNDLFHFDTDQMTFTVEEMERIMSFQFTDDGATFRFVNMRIETDMVFMMLREEAEVGTVITLTYGRV